MLILLFNQGGELSTNYFTTNGRGLVVNDKATCIIEFPEIISSSISEYTNLTLPLQEMKLHLTSEQYEQYTRVSRPIFNTLCFQMITLNNPEELSYLLQKHVSRHFKD